MAERIAVDQVADELKAAGWSLLPDPTRSGELVACRGPGHRLFMAHVDTVPESPGAVDNAAGIAALVALAHHSAADDLCLGFPRAEEAGLRGSDRLARAWPERSPSAEPRPQLVVALDLVGHGTLSVTGLGPAWGGDQLAWLHQHADLASPFAYRVVSRMLPGMERSDHLPFALRGALALHLLGRGPDGIFPRYHQPEDTVVSASAMQDLLIALEGLATAPLPPTSPPDTAARVGPVLLPAWLVTALLAAGLLSGVHDLMRPCEGRPVLGGLAGLLGAAWRAVVAGCAAALLLAGATRLGLFTPTQAERTAAAVMGLPATGWWQGALVGLLLAWPAWILLRRKLGPYGSAPLASATLAGLALLLDPLLALPFAVAALLSRFHPLLALLPALYLLWPDKLRELAFHGLVGPAQWAWLWVLAWPAMGARRPGPGWLSARLPAYSRARAAASSPARPHPLPERR